VQTAEDAREIAVKKMDEMRLANERQNSADAQAQTQGQADDAMRQKDKLSPTRQAAELPMLKPSRMRQTHERRC
jgi:hypothetical protein